MGRSGKERGRRSKRKGVKERKARELGRALGEKKVAGEVMGER